MKLFANANLLFFKDSNTRGMGLHLFFLYPLFSPVVSHAPSTVLHQQLHMCFTCQHSVCLQVHTTHVCFFLGVVVVVEYLPWCFSFFISVISVSLFYFFSLIFLFTFLHRYLFYLTFFLECIIKFSGIHHYALLLFLTETCIHAFILKIC